MKFKVTKFDSDTFARSGMLEIKNKKVRTPILWLSHYMGKKPESWKRFSIDTLLVNACDILENSKAYTEICDKGIHKYLQYNGMIMIDSGGYLFQKKNILHVSPQQICDLYHKANPELSVVLDHPLNPLVSDYLNNKRWKKTLENTVYMYENNGNIAIMPVLHGYTLRKLQNVCQQIKDLGSVNAIGLGSLVPLVFHTPGMRKFVDSMKFVVDAIKLVRKEFPETFLHTFGIGSTSSMHLLFSLGVDSIDSTGWRLKAAYGRIQLPGVGDRYVIDHPNRVNGGRKVITSREKNVLLKCKCPVCRNLTMREKIKELDESFKSRALHNAWVFNYEEKMFKKEFDSDNIKPFVVKRLRYSPFLNGLKYACG